LKILKNYIDQSQHEPLIEQQQASLIYALIQLNFGKNRQTALQFYLPYAKDYQTNLMQCYVLTYIAAKSGQNNLALKTLKSKPTGSNYAQIVYLDYIMGDLLLHQIDQNAAIWFKRYITFTKTKNANKEAYQKLSWLAWMDDDSAKFFVYHDLMQKNTKDAGSELKLINHDLGRGVFPSKQLLEARLLFDGGYYEKALQKMNNVTISALPSKFQQIEYHYRLGRIFQELGKNAEAIQSYKACLTLGKDAKTYLIPNACLQLGLVYENLNYYELAKAYYEQVLKYNQVDYDMGK
jgi:tetratricopeptide (TPR) repeat protein